MKKVFSVGWRRIIHFYDDLDRMKEEVGKSAAVCVCASVCGYIHIYIYLLGEECVASQPTNLTWHEICQ
jgi:hypothetical protein